MKHKHTHTERTVVIRPPPKVITRTVERTVYRSIEKPSGGGSPEGGGCVVAMFYLFVASGAVGLIALGLWWAIASLSHPGWIGYSLARFLQVVYVGGGGICSICFTLYIVVGICQAPSSAK